MSSDSQIDELDTIELFAKQQKVYPRSVYGFYRNLKWIIMGICLSLYYFLPLLRWERAGDIPDQAILIDMPARRAYFFMIEIWPQEVYYLVGILFLAALSLFFVTALLGRVWCGYFCFQTVWTDLFMLTERFFEGDRAARQRLDHGPWTLEKILRKSFTHFSWIVISVFTAGAFVFYFNDAPTLWQDIRNLNVSTTILGFVAGLSFMTYLMAGFAREQVCTFMCPYSRFQSGMFDDDSLVIGYDVKRGETRGKKPKDGNWEGRGHCIDCTACVQVCPTGIDIRDGLQIQCIACGLCVDACNEIMDKVNLPRGLIRYDTERNIRLRAEGQPEQYRLIRPRTIFYAFVMMVVGSVMLYGLLNRNLMELHVLQDRNPLLVQLSDGAIRNGYVLKILNKDHEDHQFSLSQSGLDQAQITFANPLFHDLNGLEVKANQVGKFKIFITSSENSSKDFQDFTLTIRNNQTGQIEERPTQFFFKK
jgi:cytochrome c oxidase accessory protein FixG